ncbi:unnamed protein product [Penicillium egyptiacum]|uniref:Uncharacterized protein n=1 Tax=Penicillium egyptiacum TaxID=1303716 RepID=A0A9W4PAE5_9EURO|nr:unnamed protein product [Penicillium egyptiacum]
MHFRVRIINLLAPPPPKHTSAIHPLLPLIMSTRNRNGSSDASLPGFERVEGRNNNRNNSNYRSRNNSNDRNRNNSNYRSRNRTSDDTPPGLERLGGQESHAEAEGEHSNRGENTLGHEEDFPDDDGEAESFLQPMWSAPDLLDHTAETSGLPMEGVVLAWRGNNTGKSVIVGYACGGFVTARLIPAARRPIPSRAPNISEKALGRRKDDLRTERDIKAWGIVAWRVDKKSVSQDPISLLKPMTRAWYPETYVYIHWWNGDASWESRHNLRYVCASNNLKTDMLIYNVAKEQEANYREALTGVRPEYAPANTQMANDHWKNVNAYRGAHWFQPRAEENRRITSIGYEPVIMEEDNSHEFDSGIGLRQGSIAGSNSDIVEEAGEEDEEGYYEGSNEDEEVVQDDREQQYGHAQQRQPYLSPIDEEGSVLESRVFFTPEVTPSRARGHGEAQRTYGISTPRATRSPSSGDPSQGNRGQAQRMLETPGNQRMPRLNQGSNRGNEQPTPESSRSNRSNQDNRRQQTPQSSQGNRSSQDNQRLAPHSSSSNRSSQDNQRQQTPQSSQGNRSSQDNQRLAPHSSSSNRSSQDNQRQRTPHSSQGNRSSQGNQRQTPQSSRSNRSNQDNQQQRTPQPSQGNPSSQENQRQTPQSSRSNRSSQDNQRQRTPQSNQGAHPNQGNQQQRTPQPSQGNPSSQENQRQTPQSSRSNRSSQDNQRQRTPQSTQGNRDQQRQAPHSSRSSRSNRSNQDNQPQTPISTQGNRSNQDNQRQTPTHSSRSNRSNQDNQRQRTPQSTQGNRSNQGNEGDQRSAGLNIPLSEGNQGQPQQRRGRGRARRGELSNPPSNLPTRRSTRHTRVPGGP